MQVPELALGAAGVAWNNLPDDWRGEPCSMQAAILETLPAWIMSKGTKVTLEVGRGLCKLNVATSRCSNKAVTRGRRLRFLKSDRSIR